MQINYLQFTSNKEFTRLKTPFDFSQLRSLKEDGGENNKLVRATDFKLGL